MTTLFDFFRSCIQAINNGTMIQRQSRHDKEFHFQHWVRDRNNELSAERVRNPNAGREHAFRALRLIDGLNTPVTLRSDATEEDSDEGDSS